MKLQSIQALRAVAAYAVVVHHVLDLLARYLKIIPLESCPRVFMSGVDVFFVISGFVMAETTAGATQPSAGAFLRKRFMRIAPTYWLLTAVTFALQLRGIKLFGESNPSVARLLSSLSFVLPLDGSRGRPEPLLFVGWSLEYEVLFYLLFALALKVGAELGPRRVAVMAVIGLSLLGSASGSPYLAHWGKPITLEFAAGIVVWSLCRRPRPFIPAVHARAILITGVGLLAASELLDGPWHAQERALFYGAPAMLIVFGAVSLERAGEMLRAPLLQHHGDASYALYLTHPFVLQAAAKLVVISGIPWWPARASAFVVLAVVLVPTVGLSFHRFVERPLGAWLAGRGASRARTRATARA